VCAVSGPLDHRAATWLRELVTLRDEGLTRPLPLPVKTSLAYQDAVSSGRDEPREAAAKEWETDPNNSFGIEGEDADPWHTLVHGGRAPLEDLIDDGLPTYAERLWAPLLAVAPKVRPL
jgi:exodeoxyribonuclease V gamma subunit